MGSAARDGEWLARLERLDIAVRRLAHGSAGGDEATPRRGTGLHFKDHRSYSPGDDPRRLDWNAWMRLGELLIRETEAEETPRILLQPDFSASMSAGASVKGLCARELALCLGAVALLRQMEVVLQPLGTREISAPFRGRHQLAAWVAEIESARKGARMQAARAQRPGLAVLITDLFGREVVDEVRRLAHEKAEIQVIHLRDPQDLDPPGGERVILEDVEDGTRIEARIDASTRRSWCRVVEEQFESLTHELRALGAVVATFNARRGAEEILLELARRGALVRH